MLLLLLQGPHMLLLLLLSRMRGPASSVPLPPPATEEQLELEETFPLLPALSAVPGGHHPWLARVPMAARLVLWTVEARWRVLFVGWFVLTPVLTAMLLRLKIGGVVGLLRRFVGKVWRAQAVAVAVAVAAVAVAVVVEEKEEMQVYCGLAGLVVVRVVVVVAVVVGRGPSTDACCFGYRHRQHRRCGCR